MAPPALIGVISDTHGLLRPEALDALRGSELIIHAGDVGKPEILDSLRAVAPVVAVRGNVDTGAWAAALPATAVIEAQSALIYVLHDVKDLDIDPAAAGFHIVISGHTHIFNRTDRGGVIYLNPGAAGPRASIFRSPTPSLTFVATHGKSPSAAWLLEFFARFLSVSQRLCGETCADPRYRPAPTVWTNASRFSREPVTMLIGGFR